MVTGIREIIVQIILDRSTFGCAEPDCPMCRTAAGDLADAIVRGTESHIDDLVDNAIEDYQESKPPRNTS